MTTAAEQAAQIKQVIDQRLGEIGARVGELEQKADRNGGPSFHVAPSPGKMLVDDDDVKSFLSQPTGGRRVGIDVKAIITSAITDADGSAGDLLVPTRDNLVAMPRRELRIRDLLPTIRVTGGSVQYAKQTGRTLNASPVAEGATKPQSELKYDLVTVDIRTIAHWVIASRQILDDAPQLQGVIDTDLRYGLGLVEDLQLLTGAGTGTDLNGIYTQATAFAAGSVVIASPTKLDVIAAAINQNALADLPADGVVLHPSDWLSMRTLKDADGNYIMGPPGGVVEPRLFGLPVVATQAMAAGTFLVGAFKLGATLYDRWEARVEVSTEDSDNFRKNLVTVLAEERVGLAVKLPTAFTKGSFAAAITDLTS